MLLATVSLNRWTSATPEQPGYVTTPGYTRADRTIHQDFAFINIVKTSDQAGEVDLPEPERPTRATVFPAGISG